MENKFMIQDHEGKEVEVELLFSFDWGITGKSYLVYTDHTTDEEGCERVYASVYDPTGQDPTLYPVETDDEWDVIEDQLNSLKKQAQAWLDFDEMKLTIID